MGSVRASDNRQSEASNTSQSFASSSPRANLSEQSSSKAPSLGSDYSLSGRLADEVGAIHEELQQILDGEVISPGQSKRIEYLSLLLSEAEIHGQDFVELYALLRSANVVHKWANSQIVERLNESTDSPIVTMALIEASHSAHSYVQQKAIEALASRPGKNAQNRLIEALQDEDMEVKHRCKAAEGLKHHPSPESARALGEMSVVPELLWSVAVGLSGQNDLKSKLLIENIARGAEATSGPIRNSGARKAAIEFLGERDTPESTAILLGILSNGDWVRNFVIDALAGQTTTEARLALRNMLEQAQQDDDFSDEDRARLEKALQRSDPTATPDITAIVEQLEAQSLDHIQITDLCSSIEGLVHSPFPEVKEVAKLAAEHPNNRIRCSAYYLLGNASGPELSEFLVERLRYETQWVEAHQGGAEMRTQVYALTSAIRSQRPHDAVPFLIPLLKSSLSSLRVQAGEILCSFEDSAALAAVLGRWDVETDSDVKQSLLSSLSLKQTPEVQAALINTLANEQDISLATVKSYIEALSAFGTKEARDAIYGWASDSQPAAWALVRGYAIKALQDWVEPEITKTLIDLLEGDAPEDKRIAANALATHRCEAATKALINLHQTTTSNQIREACEYALTMHGYPPEESTQVGRKPTLSDSLAHRLLL